MIFYRVRRQTHSLLYFDKPFRILIVSPGGDKLIKRWINIAIPTAEDLFQAKIMRK